MEIQENIPLRPKTTMRIGGTAKYYAELETKEDVEAAIAFAEEKNVPFIILGGGSNMIFADGTIDAFVARIATSTVTVENETVSVDSGKNLPQLINELAEQGLDLSPLTGILGTVGGAVFGNAGQGPQGTWINGFVDSVTAYVDSKWKTMSNEDCNFSYRESWFKEKSQLPTANCQLPPVIWSVTLNVPKKDPAEIKSEIERLLQQRIDTQPHVKTAGSCFKAVGGTSAWQLIDAAGLRDTKSNDVHISEKHANFLINDGEATFEDAVNVVKTIEEGIDSGLEVEMRFVKEDGTLEF
jgi:UDP-N-acetylmuramate dehydrogenase